METAKLIITIPKYKYQYIQGLEHGNTDYATTRMLYHAVKNAKPLDTVEKKGEWIPANDPPKETGRYLVYIVNEYDEKLQYIMTADYIARPKPIEGLSPWNVDDECASDNVVAWMPLPEPYKEGGE